MVIKDKLKDNILEIIGVKNIEESVPGIGGGFQYCELSEELFNEFGLLNEKITFNMIAKHIYFTEFGVALKEDQINEKKFFAGKFKNKALYIYPDKKFTRKDLNNLSKDFREFIIYADSTTLSTDQLKEFNITFKKLPFEIKDK
jgi:adenine-specific DNA-methyltransferase